MRRLIQQITSLLLLSLVAIGCDNAVESDGITYGEPTGILVFDAHIRVATTGSSSSGGIEIVEGEDFHPMYIMVTDSRGRRFTPSDGGYTLGWEIVDTSIAYVTTDPDASWDFAINNRRSGVTGVKIALYKEGKEIFSATEVPVRVLPLDRSGGVVIKRGDSALITISATGKVTGTIEVEEGEEFIVRKSSGDPTSLQLYFIDSAGAEHRPGENFYSSLHVESENQSIVREVVAYIEHAEFKAEKGGETVLRFQLTHHLPDIVETGIGGYYTLWKSPPVPIRVKPYSERKVAGFLLRQNGSEVARVENGVTTGRLSVSEGDVARDIEIYFLDSQGTPFPPSTSDTRLLKVEIGDKAVAIASPDDLPVAGSWKFSLFGIQRGATSLTLSLLPLNNGLVSSPIPVDVLP